MAYVYDNDYSRTQAKVGAMMRNIAGDMSYDFWENLDSWYLLEIDKENKEELELAESCSQWHKNIERYSNDKQKAQGLIAIIMHSFDIRHNLDKDPNWLKLIRFIMPNEFMQMVDSQFTQVPKLAVRTDHHPNKGKRDKHMFTDARMI